ncbi:MULTISPECIES: ArnT family glycosyltransferase [unclassified Desulfurobacterium]|uniref:ArnT family glycosyltransferase n=1 Tax=unclassified Desulfurobacterium TaxID=2639089 RepID=UPI000410DD71|nr:MULTISPECIES: glycosyltransferase family 39 protein [unclassified Desulfurobacterium]
MKKVKKKLPAIDRKTLNLFLIMLFLAGTVNLWLLTLHHEEPRRGIVALEMLFRHNFVQPTVLMVPYFKKPPLHNWITILFAGFNPHWINEFTLRFPSLVATGLTALFLYYFVKEKLDERRAVFSSIIFMTTWTVLIGYSTKCEPDMLFTLFTFLSISLWYHFFDKNRKFIAWTVGYFLASLALLTKGLPGILFFIISYIVVLFSRKELKELLTLQHIAGIVIGLMPFFLWVMAVSPEKAVLTLWHEAVRRTAVDNPVTKTLKGIILFIPRFILALFPWSLFVIYEIIKDKGRVKVIENPFMKEIAFIIIANITVYLFSPGTRMRYIIPLIPFISILLAEILKDKKVNPQRSISNIQFLMDILLFLGIITTIWLTLHAEIALNSTIFFLIVAYFIYFYAMKRIDVTNFILMAGCTLFIIRGFYSGYYLSIAEFKYPKYKKAAWEISTITKGDKLSTLIPELKTGFYIEKFRQQPLPLKRKTELEKGEFFITEKPFDKQVKEFKLGNRVLYLCKKE